MIKHYTIEQAKTFMRKLYDKAGKKDKTYVGDFLREGFKDREEIVLFAYVVLHNYFDRDFGDKWYEYLEFVDIGNRNKTNKASKCTRGFGKTAISLVLSNIYEIANDVFRYIVFNAYDTTATIDKIKLIKDEFENNQMLRLIYGDPIKQKDYWNKTDLEIYGHCRVKGISTGQNPRGLLDRGTRPDKVLSDDVLDLMASKSEEQREKSIEWYTKALKFALAKDGVMELLGTPMHEEDLLETIFKKQPPFQNWDTIEIPATIDGTAGGKSIDENWITTEVLAEEAQDEITFTQERLCKPISYASGIIKFEDLRWYDYFPKHNDKNTIKQFYMHADTTHTAKQTSDYFCIVVAGEDHISKLIYIMDYFIGKISVEKQAKKYIEFYMRYAKDYECMKATYDEKANQGFGFWVKKMAREEYNVSLPIQELGYPNDKVTHFQPHVPHFKSNRIYLPNENANKKIALDQLLAFPDKAIHDDFVDGLSGVLDNFKWDSSLLSENLTDDAHSGLLDYEEF